MKNSAEEIRALKAILELVPIAERQAAALEMVQSLTNAVMAGNEIAERQATALEKIAEAMTEGTLTGVVNVLDDIDTRLSHMSADIEKIHEAL